MYWTLWEQHCHGRSMSHQALAAAGGWKRSPRIGGQHLALPTGLKHPVGASGRGGRNTTGWGPKLIPKCPTGYVSRCCLQRTDSTALPGCESVCSCRNQLHTEPNKEVMDTSRPSLSGSHCGQSLVPYMFLGYSEAPAIPDARTGELGTGRGSDLIYQGSCPGIHAYTETQQGPGTSSLRTARRDYYATETKSKARTRQTTPATW